jgi:pimeloyl-ACP methyl ester carboxylesterase/class 3 adenylate cyclase
MSPDVRYANAGGVNIAYQVVGDGPIDMVLVPGWLSNIEVFWEEPRVSRFLMRLASFVRLILFDKRGTGLSDRVTQAATLEERIDDVRAVMDAIGSQRAALFGYSEGGSMCALFAATHPNRVQALIMMGTYARRGRAPDYPWAPAKEEILAWTETFPKIWGTPVGIDQRAPSVAQDLATRQWWARYLRMSASPATARALTEANLDIDIRSLLPSIRVPSLIMHSINDATIPYGAGEHLAQSIPGSKLVTLTSVDHVPFFDGAEEVIRCIEEFLTGTSQAEAINSSVQTLLFSDIIGSTETAMERGNERWTDLLEAYRRIIRAELRIYRGQEIDTAGDGFLASFDGPARAVRCATAISRGLKKIAVATRIGLHTGECEVRGKQLSGVALHIAARVAALASSDNILVSQTVKDLVAGSGLQFVDAGSHVLKGVPDERRLFKVVTPVS